MKFKRYISYIFVVFIFHSCTSNSSIQLPGNNKPGYIIVDGTSCYFEFIKNSVTARKIAVNFPSFNQQQKISDITAYIGLPQNVLLLTSDIKGVLACRVQGKNIVLFDRNMFSANDSLVNYWPDYYMLAHAIGHHLSNHFYQSSIDLNSAEVEADRFAGATLYRLGASIEQTIAGLQTGKISHFSGIEDTSSVRSRIITLKEGYDDASNQFIYQLATPPPPVREPNLNLKTEFKIGDFADDSLQTHLSSIYDSAKMDYEGIITYTSIDSARIDSGSISPSVPDAVVEVTKSDKRADAVSVGQRINLTFPELKYNTPMQKKDRKNYILILKRGVRLHFRFYFYKYFNNVYYVKYLKR